MHIHSTHMDFTKIRSQDLNIVFVKLQSRDGEHYANPLITHGIQLHHNRSFHTYVHKLKQR